MPSTDLLFRRAGTLALALTLGACAAHDGPSAAPPTLASIELGTTPAILGGPDVPLTAQITNPGDSLTGMTLEGEIAQSGSTASTGVQGLSCGGNSPDGTLPQGGCVVASAFTVPVGPIGGAPFDTGAATFTLLLREDGVVRDSVSAALTLLPNTLGIAAITVDPAPAVIGGPASHYTAYLWNPGTGRTGAFLQGYLIQGTARRAASGSSVVCGAGAGVFPTGPCVQTTIFGASNTASGTGTLVAGPATLQVIYADAGTGADTVTAPVVLQAP